MMTDAVDRILAQWEKARPDLDCRPMGIFGRISRASRVFGSRMEQVFEKEGLSTVEFDILATLRRSQAPLTPTQLYQTLMLSSGAMSTRIDQLVKRGLLQRQASDEDRRSNRVALTEAGRHLIDSTLEAHVENQHRMASALDSDEQHQLACLLRKLMTDEQR
ncbi:MarR family transcriptional regulator [bacterium Scap17]|uniref:MarR family winged helix-turn-helix transcriptional regulator n=1 Tax=Cobetia amphilecti TaxID=1055104 RepID=UPI00159DA816|nr:MarR family transcriptional regulator [Cobetia amphilecti]NVN56335.1 MarR family transcriptional regulator [bacterium Scap17]UBU47602.1 MarR family transcriptional regulator [Cobetia amphilecti]